MSAWAQRNIVEVGDEHSSSKRHGQGGRQVLGLEETVGMGDECLGLMVKVGDRRLGSKECGQGG